MFFDLRHLSASLSQRMHDGKTSAHEPCGRTQTNRGYKLMRVLLTADIVHDDRQIETERI